MEIKIDKKNKFLSNLLSKKYNSNIINNKNFPKDTKYEKELNTNFKYFNVLWYDPNYSNNLDLFKKCFEHVQFYWGDDFYSTINFFKKESISEWIVVTPGSLGKELILNLESFQCIKAFFIYCDNPQFHDWATKIKKVKCITSALEILCKKFIDLNNSYFYPNFNYSSKEVNDNNIYLEYSENKNFILLKEFREKRNKIKDKYNNLCIKYINYLDNNDILDKLSKIDVNENIVLNSVKNKINLEIDKSLYEDFNKEIFINVELIILLSLYFSKYPYLFNLLSYQEVKNLFAIEMPPDILSESQPEIFCEIDKLCVKILNNESILDEKDKIKEIQIFIIQSIAHSFRESKQTKIINEEYYQIFNFFRDIDFCLKLYVISYFVTIKNKKVNFINEILFALSACEPRYLLYIYYSYQLFNSNKFNENKKNIINNSLKLNDFIVLGNNIFHDKIKIIEKNTKSKSFKYLNIEQIEDYIDEKKKDKNNILTYFYFLIIRYEEYNENFENIVTLSFKSGVTFLVFLYIENMNKFYKNNFFFLLSTILVYSPEDILIYLSQNFDFYNPLDLPDNENIGE